MAAFTSQTTGQWEAEGQSTWNEAGHPQAGDTVTIQNTHVVTQVQNETCAGITVDVGGTWDQATFNQACSGAIAINGTHIEGVSADTGLTTVGFTTGGASSTVNWQTGSLISNSGTWNIAAGTTWTNNYRGQLTQTASADMFQENEKYLYGITVDVGMVGTLTGNSSFTGASSAGGTTLNGTFACGAFFIAIGGNPFVLGASSGLSGSSAVYLIIPGSNITVSQATPYTHTGAIKNTAINYYIPAIDAPDAYVQAVGNDNGSIIFGAGTIKTGALYLTTSTGKTVSYDATTNDTNFEISGIVNFNHGGLGTPSWAKGNGTFTLTGSSGTQDINFNVQHVEAIVTDCAGAIKEVAGDFETDSLSGSGGTLRSTVADTERTITVTDKGVATGCTFKDIHLSAASMVDAKDNCVNGGNTKGFVFNDVLTTV